MKKLATLLLLIVLSLVSYGGCTKDERNVIPLNGTWINTTYVPSESKDLGIWECYVKFSESTIYTGASLNDMKTAGHLIDNDIPCSVGDTYHTHRLPGDYTLDFGGIIYGISIISNGQTLTLSCSGSDCFHCGDVEPPKIIYTYRKTAE